MTITGAPDGWPAGHVERQRDEGLVPGEEQIAVCIRRFRESRRDRTRRIAAEIADADFVFTVVAADRKGEPVAVGKNAGYRWLFSPRVVSMVVTRSIAPSFTESFSRPPPSRVSSGLPPEAGCRRCSRNRRATNWAGRSDRRSSLGAIRPGPPFGWSCQARTRSSGFRLTRSAGFLRRLFP